MCSIALKIFHLEPVVRWWVGGDAELCWDEGDAELCWDERGRRQRRHVCSEVYSVSGLLLASLVSQCSTLQEREETLKRHSTEAGGSEPYFL